jgi:hypothetical protein
LRILYIVSRPADTGFLDPRLTARALFDALDPLGGSVRVDFCRPPTLARMDEMLRDEQRAGDPYDLVHFDGHGTFLLDRFYRELVRGTTIGQAVAEARKALLATPARWIETGPGGRTVELHDWFLPHLYQRAEDDTLVPPDVTRQQPAVEASNGLL